MRFGRPLSIYLDTNAVIASIEGGNEGVTSIFEHAAAESLRLCTSELTLAEALVGAFKQKNAELAQIYEGLITSNDVLTVLPIDRQTLRKSAEIRATLGNSGPDAIHVATAAMSACTILLSSDGRLRLPAGLMQVRLEDIGDLELWS